MNKPINNIFKDLPLSPNNDEVFDIILKNKQVRIERIVSSGQNSPENFWYEQKENEFVILLKGSAVLEFDDHTVALGPGDYMNIPAYQRHRVESTSQIEQTIWLAFFY